MCEPLRVGFAGVTVAVETEDASCRALVDKLFAAMSAREGGETRATLRLERVAPTTLRLERDGRRLYLGANKGVLAGILLEEVIGALVAASGDGLLLHAAVVARDGHTVLLPGASGAGKSTLAAVLAAAGWTVGTDELAWLATGSQSLETFRRPLSLKVGGVPLVEALGVDLADPAVHHTATGVLVPTELLGDDPSRGSRFELGSVVFPSFSKEAGFMRERLSPATAAVRLHRCVVNAAALGGDGFREVLRLGREFPAWAWTYDGSAGLAEALERHARADGGEVA